MSFYIDNFKTVFDTKDNIQALRNKVFELAIQGKLVEQDANDEPASGLLSRIKVEKDDLVKEGKIKKQKLLSRIEEDEIPFVIPENWKWVRLGEITNYGNNATLTPDNINVDDWVIELEDIEKNSSKILKIVLNKERQTKSNKNKFLKDDVLYGKLRPYLKKVIVASNDGVCTTEIVAFRGYSDISSLYIMNYFKSPYVDNYVNSITYGMKMPRLGTEDAKELLFPLPPINEQHRIVSKIESLMNEIDKLEESLQKKEYIIGLFPKAVVDVIGKCQTSEELKEHLQFIIENFETIYQTPDSMQELTNVILQLAIEGKLVPQDKTDEPASELVKKIKVEKDNLVKEGKIKKQQPLLRIEEDEISFEIPESWEWVKAGDLCDVINYGYTASSIQNNTGTKLLRITDIQNGKVEWGNVPFCEIDNEKVGQYKLNENDIVIARTGGTVGKSFIIKNVNTQAVYASYLIRMISNKNLNPDYYYLMLNSPLYWTQISYGARGGAQPNVNAQMLSNLILPLPPLAEQHRIVQKVESIMSLIDEMENKLKRKVRLVEKMVNV